VQNGANHYTLNTFKKYLSASRHYMAFQPVLSAYSR